MVTQVSRGGKFLRTSLAVALLLASQAQYAQRPAAQRARRCSAVRSFLVSVLGPLPSAHAQRIELVLGRVLREVGAALWPREVRESGPRDCNVLRAPQGDKRNCDLVARSRGTNLQRAPHAQRDGEKAPELGIAC